MADKAARWPTRDRARAGVPERTNPVARRRCFPRSGRLSGELTAEPSRERFASVPPLSELTMWTDPKRFGSVRTKRWLCVVQEHDGECEKCNGFEGSIVGGDERGRLKRFPKWWSARNLGGTVTIECVLQRGSNIRWEIAFLPPDNDQLRHIPQFDVRVL